MDQYQDQNLPDIQTNTHIIGICGVNDHVDEWGFNASSPQRDGWFIADFYLLHTLFKGLAKSQTWLTCLNPLKLVQRYGEYAHGSCFLGRRVVLSKDQAPDFNVLTVHEPSELLERTLATIRQVCETAYKSRDPVLICIFGHGNETTYGIEIGGEGENGPLLKPKNISQILDDYPGLQVCLLLTSCYSGGWSVSPDFGTTIHKPAGSENESPSWPDTPSLLGRYCGSIYISSLLNVLQKDTSTEEGARSQPMTTKEFAKAVKHELIGVPDPRFPDDHGQTFTVQEDKWLSLYHERTGYPLAIYKQRLEELRLLPPISPVDIRQNRSATEVEGEKWKLEHPEARTVIMASIRTGSFNAVHNAIRKQAIQYMNSKPGPGNNSNDIAAFGLFNQIIKKPETISGAGWEGAYDLVEHRTKSLLLATKIASKLGLPGPSITEWDVQEWWKKNSQHTELMDKISRLIIDAELFPPMLGTRRNSSKPRCYLTAVFLANNVPIDRVKFLLEMAKNSKYFLLHCVHTVLERLSVVDKTVEESVESLQKTMSFKIVADYWTASLRRRDRTLSPTKKISSPRFITGSSPIHQ